MTKAWIFTVALLVAASSTMHAQTAQPAEHHHEEPAGASSWHLMQDGVLFLNVNNQHSARGGTELAPQNWWMGIAQRPAGGGTLQFNLMASLDPATLGGDGYRELFLVGET